MTLFGVFANWTGMNAERFPSGNSLSEGFARANELILGI